MKVRELKVVVEIMNLHYIYVCIIYIYAHNVALMGIIKIQNKSALRSRVLYHIFPMLNSRNK